MKKLIIITDEFYDIQRSEIRIGGLFTYIDNLAKLGNKLNFQVSVFQLGDTFLNIQLNEYFLKVFDFKLYTRQKLYDKVRQDFKDAIVIISSDQLDIKTHSNKTITIQHGIAFDTPYNYDSSMLFKNKNVSPIFKMLRVFKNLIRYSKSTNLVCVDYNYYNWLKISGNINTDKKLSIIPNFTKIQYDKGDITNKLLNRKRKQIRKILFARRFIEYRGVVLFSDICKKILKNFENVEITFAGDGPFENYLINKFQNNPHITITKFNNKQSLPFHYLYDIAVIPSIYSEGTSLSLLESMSAGCLPLATCVGGITNIIIDGYNGVLTQPNENDLYNCLNEILSFDDNKFDEIVLNAFNTAAQAFSIANWENKWTKLIQEVDTKI
jgi:glycosyltransferase involved in cell wall biosynthesis